MTGQATNLGNLATSTGSQISGIDTGTASQQAALNTGLGQSQSNVYNNVMTQLLGLDANTTNQEIQGGSQALQAGQQASASEFNALLGGIGSLTGLLRPTGSSGGGPSILSNIGSGIGGLFGMLGL